MSSVIALDQFRACLLGGSIGDALGAPIEFHSLGEIRRQFGPDGIRDYHPLNGRVGAITDDTQMMLFTLEGLIRAHYRWLDRGICHVPTVVWHAYLRWLFTQHEVPQYDYPDFVRSGWLFEQEKLHHLRAPGNSCLSALRGHVRPATRDDPVNDSKGCGGIMRIAPVGLIAREPFRLGAELAALTHGHPSGYLAAGFFAQIVSILKNGDNLEDAIHQTLNDLSGWEGSEECIRAVNKALDFAKVHTPRAEVIEELGGGWVAEEALSISLYCALVAKDFREGVLLAVNHSGDSDSTGMLAGNLLGLLHGVDSIPAEWIERLEVRDIIEEMCRDAVAAFGNSSETAIADRQGDKYPPN